MDQSANPSVPARLHYLKCIQCRKDKKKCLPLGRSWPLEKCERCAKYRYSCSASMTAKQEKELQQQQVVERSVPGIPRSIYSAQVGPVFPDPEPVEGTQQTKQTDGAAPLPKCAPYFNDLANPYWFDFGLTPPPEKVPFLEALMNDANAIETGIIYRALKKRLLLIDAARRFRQHAEEGMSSGMSLEESRIYASRRLMCEIGKKEANRAEQGDTDLEVSKFVRNFDKTITKALRWQALFEAVGVHEVLLISDNYYEPNSCEAIPVPDIESVSDEEWPVLLNRLLSPALGLKETCLKLSGVADMIQHLKDLGESDLRRYLADSIQHRIEAVLGSEKSLVGDEDETEDDDESMADSN